MRRFFALTALVGILVLVSGCGSSDSEKETNSTTSPKGDTSSRSGDERTVVLEVTGNGPASIFYGSGNEPSVALPWKKTITEKSKLLVSIVASGQLNEQVTCRITVEGEPVIEHTAEVAKCEHTLK